MEAVVAFLGSFMSRCWRENFVWWLTDRCLEGELRLMFCCVYVIAVDWGSGVIGGAMQFGQSAYVRMLGSCGGENWMGLCFEESLKIMSSPQMSVTWKGQKRGLNISILAKRLGVFPPSNTSTCFLQRSTPTHQDIPQISPIMNG
eukprot:11011364-Ditylum_brightwellii.AAC.1